MTIPSIRQEVARSLKQAIPAASKLIEYEIRELLTTPPNPELGDLAFPCFVLAKELKKSPAQIAKELAEQLLSSSALENSLIYEATPTGPYINLRIHVGQAAALLLPRWAHAEEPQVIHPETPQAKTRIMVEYSQPNTHKAFHVGHLRNLCLGDALVRLLRADGYPVLAVNYFGDVGAHIAKCLWWYLDILEAKERTPPSQHRGEWLGKLYTQATNCLAVWEEKAAQGDLKAQEKLVQAKTRIGEILQKLEAREPEITRIWQETRQWSLDEFAEIYTWCGVKFDRDFFESEVDETGLALVDEYLQKGVFVRSQGAVGIENPEIAHMPFFLLRKQDGTSLYSTKDLALARMKFATYDIDRSIYVVDVRQSDHFRHVFLTLKKMGFPQAENCKHVPYEMVELPDGAMSARKGNVVLFRELQQNMCEHIKSRYLDKFKHEWTAEAIDSTAHEVALGAIKYGMLARDVQQKIIFDMDAWLALEGNTGPYLQYTHARAASILRKCAEVHKTLDSDLLQPNPPLSELLAATSALQTQQERDLLLMLDQLPATVHLAASQLRPSLVCTYLYELCKTFNRFEKHCSVKPQSGPLLQGRLLLVTATVHALAWALHLLGIPAPQRM